MSLPLLLQGFGSVGLFASRAFLPAFVTALMLRFGPQYSWLAHTGLLPHVRNLPAWFTSDVALFVLGLLAVLELVAERSPEARDLLQDVFGYLKAVMAAVTYVGVMKATERDAIGGMLRQAGWPDAGPILAVGAGTYFLARSRSNVLTPLVDADEDDDLGLQKLFRWVGDLWGSLGTVALVVFPILAIVGFGLAVVALILIERRIEARGDRAQVPCPHCSRPIHACARVCPACQVEVEQPRGIGWLGLPKRSPADLASLPYQLVAVKRCPSCATRFRRRAVRQDCPACGRGLMDDPAFLANYVAFVDRRAPMVFVACFVLGLIPVLGVIPGVICYRLAIVGPFRRYIPRFRGFLLRWGIRLAVLVLVGLQWVPVAGWLALPAMALINYAAYRSSYRALALG